LTAPDLSFGAGHQTRQAATCRAALRAGTFLKFETANPLLEEFPKSPSEIAMIFDRPAQRAEAASNETLSKPCENRRSITSQA